MKISKSSSFLSLDIDRRGRVRSRYIKRKIAKEKNSNRNR